MPSTYSPTTEIQLFECADGAFAPADHLTLGDVAALRPSQRAAYEAEMRERGFEVRVDPAGRLMVWGVVRPVVAREGRA